MTYSFRNDYSEIAHPSILQALTESNLVQTIGYGQDIYCEKAARQIQGLCTAPDTAIIHTEPDNDIDDRKPDVYFLPGGTITNLVVIASFLQPYEAVIAAESGHICTHETGAIEASGHKICAVPAPDGKLNPERIQSVINRHTSEHMVRPRLVYISNTTESGGVYTRSELQAIHDCCAENHLYLYMDGARLASALASPENDVTLPEITRYTDAFSIGGTKNGLLFGEAVILQKRNPYFRWHMKQRGAMTAKGRLLGVQFQTILQDDLWLKLARHANTEAFRLRDGLRTLGVDFLIESSSNQQFPIISTEAVERLQKLGYEFEIQKKLDETHTCIRLVTSWATPEEAVQNFLSDAAAVLQA